MCGLEPASHWGNTGEAVPAGSTFRLLSGMGQSNPLALFRLQRALGALCLYRTRGFAVLEMVVGATCLEQEKLSGLEWTQVGYMPQVLQTGLHWGFMLVSTAELPTAAHPAQLDRQGRQDGRQWPLLIFPDGQRDL